MTDISFPPNQASVQEAAKLSLACFIYGLKQAGVEQFVVSPGSRNTPLIRALIDQNVTIHSIIDERSAGFFALGLCKATAKPVGICCTSGSAGANYLPAVVEADHSELPLLVVTADRPSELHDVGAGQTMPQTDLFTSYARYRTNFDPALSSELQLKFAATLGSRCVAIATGETPGPVHINVQLREPFALNPESPVDPSKFVSPTKITRTHQGVDEGTLRSFAAKIVTNNSRPLIICGRFERDPNLGSAVSAFADLLQIPLFACPLSGARKGSASIDLYGQILKEWSADEYQPSVVIRIGDLPTSKPLRTWLGGLPSSSEQIQISPNLRWQDPSSVLTEQIVADPRNLLQQVAPLLASYQPNIAWLEGWQQLQKQFIASHLDKEVSAQPTGSWLAKELSASLPVGSSLLVAASMPIRDIENNLRSRDGLTVMSNRGVNGIDGTIATALGIASANPKKPTALLIGDVAFLHDSGSLISASSSLPPLTSNINLTIVVIDNGGGAIFSYLPVAKSGDQKLLDLISTPTQLDLYEYAKAAKASYFEVTSKTELVPALRAAVTEAGVSILHVRSSSPYSKQA